MKVVRVVAAAIVDETGRVLIAKRPEHVHQGGLWEFPGGKIEADETPCQALVRELQEELDIQPTAVAPLIQISHQYPDKAVHLDVQRVTTFVGEPRGCEGQPLRWLLITELKAEEFPAANRAIIDALQLPDRYLITGDWRDLEDFQRRLQTALDNGIRMVQLRLKVIPPDLKVQLINVAKELCGAVSAKLILNTGNIADGRYADGIHLSSEQLSSLTTEDLQACSNGLIGASCHNQAQIDQAAALGARYLSISPVVRTSSHPDTEPMGWKGFQTLAHYSCMPAYALGGMKLGDINQAVQQGGQGIAAISEFWPD